jgi:hypothetical protein
MLAVPVAAFLQDVEKEDCALARVNPEALLAQRLDAGTAWPCGLLTRGDVNKPIGAVDILLIPRSRQKRPART